MFFFMLWATPLITDELKTHLLNSQELTSTVKEGLKRVFEQLGKYEKELQSNTKQDRAALVTQVVNELKKIPTTALTLANFIEGVFTNQLTAVNKIKNAYADALEAIYKDQKLALSYFPKVPVTISASEVLSAVKNGLEELRETNAKAIITSEGEIKRINEKAATLIEEKNALLQELEALKKEQSEIEEQDKPLEESVNTRLEGLKKDITEKQQELKKKEVTISQTPLSDTNRQLLKTEKNTLEQAKKRSIELDAQLKDVALMLKEQENSDKKLKEIKEKMENLDGFENIYTI